MGDAPCRGSELLKLAGTALQLAAKALLDRPAGAGLVADPARPGSLLRRPRQLGEADRARTTARRAAGRAVRTGVRRPART
ncbi:hypothetical protein LI90_545 [Carbonactinospora thermoautotrophica]|uniref:Uncharacterized protein n=1 Tax=Carbonactinospora thermoautotrophica TaxID=1469144 RepID=A0A132MMG3_9ACTN|nr:hypothetical protein [Carbonactinospora thermoautotrophica]KWW98915.1 hypothetical protein LI90_545 [Carbonactinospora thermoautotrophica]